MTLVMRKWMLEESQQEGKNYIIEVKAQSDDEQYSNNL